MGDIGRRETIQVENVACCRCPFSAIDAGPRVIGNAIATARADVVSAPIQIQCFEAAA